MGLVLENEQKLTMCKGVQGSGKSFWAKDYVKKNKNTVRVNNDQLRLMMFDRVFDENDTKYIDSARELLIESFLEKGMSVIVDNMNLSSKYELRYRQMAEKYKIIFEIKDFTGVPLQICIDRDKRRENPVGEKVIRKMYKQFIEKKPPNVDFIRGLPSAIYSDLDGTLSIMKDRSPYEEEKCINDLVNESVKRTIELFSSAGYKIILCSGRDEGRGRKATEEWLKMHNIPYDYLMMRGAGDTRKDSIVKKEIYESEMKGKFNILFCLDDRDQVVRMFREDVGLPVFQVNYGDF